MNIGIDVDGVLTNLSEFILENGEKFLNNDNQYINEYVCEFGKMFNCSKEVENKFWKKYIWKYCLKAKCEKDAGDVIRALRLKGNKVYIITSRVHTTEYGIVGDLFRKMLEYWLKKNNIEYDGIYYCSEDKSAKDKHEVCKKLNIDIMIEDSIDNVIEISKTCCVMLRNRPYNLGYNRVMRVNGFKDIYYKIQSKEKGKYKKYGCKN